MSERGQGGIRRSQPDRVDPPVASKELAAERLALPANPSEAGERRGGSSAAFSNCGDRRWSIGHRQIAGADHRPADGADALPRTIHSPRPVAKVYGRIGELEVRLARTKSDIRLAQRLRYQVFYESMSAAPEPRANPPPRRGPLRRDLRQCWSSTSPEVHRSGAGGAAPRWSAPIGCCARRSPSGRRILHPGRVRHGSAARGAPPDYRFLELGRSCVLKPYRNKRTVELLWHGLWSYVREHGST